jgi:hypothetical protein
MEEDPVPDLISADIEMVVTFEMFPYMFFRNEKKVFHFVALWAPDDRWHWLPQPSKQGKG